MNGRTSLLIALAALATGAAAVSCRDATGPDDGWARTIRLDSPTDRSELVGDTFRIGAAVLDTEGKTVPGAPLAFTSDRPEIASVDSSGLVTPLAPGTARITAWSGRFASTVDVHVSWGELASIHLDTPSGGVIHASLWGLTPTYVRFRVVTRNGATGVCGQVPLSFTTDSLVAWVEHSPLPGDPCMLRIVPRGQGTTALKITGPGLDVTPATVHVSNDRYRLWLDHEDGNLVAGALVTYRVTVMDETGRPAAGVPLRFDTSDGTVLESPVSTDPAGTARVHWSLPADRVTPTLRAVVADGGGSSAEARPTVKRPSELRWTFQRVDGSGDVYTGMTLQYRVTVADDAGRPVRGLLLSFEAFEGTATPQSARTDTAGTATVSWTMPKRVPGYSSVSIGVLVGSYVGTYRLVQLKPRYLLVGGREDGRQAKEGITVGSTIPVRYTAVDQLLGQPLAALPLLVASTPDGTPAAAKMVTDATGTVRITWGLPTRLSGQGTAMAATLVVQGQWPDGEPFSVPVSVVVVPDVPATILPAAEECTPRPGRPPACVWIVGGIWYPGPTLPWSERIRGDTVISGPGTYSALGAMLVDRYSNVTAAVPTIIADQDASIIGVGMTVPGRVASSNFIRLAPGFTSQWVTITYPGIAPRRVLVCPEPCRP